MRSMVRQGRRFFEAEGARIRQRLCHVVLFGLLGCNNLLGLTEYSVRQDSVSPGDCEAEGEECFDPRSEAEPSCADVACSSSLASEDCRVLTGPAQDVNALRLGTLFATSGALKAESVARERAALLAVRELNEAGGVTAPAGGAGRPLVLIGCDASRDYKRAAMHLVALGVVAIIGPESSQTMLDLATNVTIPAQMLLISPVAIASNLGELQDDDLTWLMAPSAKQRSPLISAQIERLLSRLSEQRMRPPRLGVVFREDTFGRAALATLLGLPVDGMSLAQRSGANGGPRLEGYGTNTHFDPSSLVDSFRKQVPDAMLLIGLTELVNGFIAPLEDTWATGESKSDAPRPVYIMTDGLRVPELLALADAQPDLNDRLYGTAFVPSGAALPIYEGFRAALHTHYPSTETELHGVAATYDAAYALAYAVASLDTSELRGPKIARALHERFDGSDEVTVGRDGIVAAIRQLSAGGKVHLLGASGPVRWDETGARSEGSVAVYCVGKTAGKSYFVQAGVTLDVSTGKLSGEFGDCRSGSAHVRREDRDAVGFDGDAGANPMASSAADAQPPSNTSAWPPTAAGKPADDASDGLIHCGHAECDSHAEQFCCIAHLRPQAGGPQPEDYSCSSSTMDCAAELHCGNDAACGGGMSCCGSGNAAACTSGPLCELRLGVHLGCTARRDCGESDVCCAAPCIPGPAGFCELNCRTRCNDTLGESAVCDTDAECQAGLRCSSNPAWLGVKICQL
jgi:ABC-type branched-subunit amino acid transport system substrate-binding protein